MATRDLSHAVEDYAKAIFVLEERTRGPVTNNAIAERIGVTPASASSMVKKLDGLGLVAHVPYRGVRLTPRGRRVALEILRHHRLLERYLVEELGVPWDRVHDEAEVLEHVLSEDLEARIAEKLGDPRLDPHGDPIPTADFELEQDDTRPLAELEIGATGFFARVSDADPAKLRYLAERGIAPGMALELVGAEPFGGPLRVCFDGSEHALGRELAQAMRVSSSRA
jgi:DtxR family Mn-dependent transcriptional regulator